MTDLIKCPGCDLELPVDDNDGQITHMQTQHPEIITERLKKAGVANFYEVVKPAPDPANWSCQIGEVPRELLGAGLDGPMRDAVEAKFRELFGRDCDYTFSGWGFPLPERYRAVVEDRMPDPDLA